MSDCRKCGRALPPRTRRHTCGQCKGVAVEPTFVGVDGEGITVCACCGIARTDDVILVCACGSDTWDHRYVLLSVGTESLLPTKGKDRLYWWEIFAFVHDYSISHPQEIMVGFFLGYDFSQWLKTIDVDKAKELLSAEGIKARRRTGENPIPHPVELEAPDGTAWEMDYLPARRMKFRPRGAAWAYVCDSGPFWQMSFLRVLNPRNWPTPVCSPDEYAVVEEGKKNRSVAQLDQSMVKYNVLENDLLARVTLELHRGFKGAGVHLKRTQWFGPGQLAQAWLGQQSQVPTREDIERTVPQQWLTAATHSYYGGWFMQAMHGYVEPTLWEYDINSAYSWILAHVPCLMHGKYLQGVGDLPDTPWILCDVTTQSPDTRIGCGLMFRRVTGNVHTPQLMRGVYWRPEIEAAKRATGMTVHIHRWWAYEPCDCSPPLRGLIDLYLERLAVGKNTARGKALKLLYVSMYGKFAQSVGDAKYSNPIYASLTTAGCRTMILDAISSHPMGSDALAMVATDGVYFTQPHPGIVSEAEKLGAWERQAKHSTTLFKPGVYWDQAARDALPRAVSLKSRGINGAALARHIERIDTEFKRMADRGEGEWPLIEIPIPFQLVSPSQALARGKWHTCGAIHLGRIRHESANPVLKRDPSFEVDSIEGAKVMRTRVWTRNDGDFQSAPYARLSYSEGSLGEDGLPCEAGFGEWMKE